MTLKNSFKLLIIFSLMALSFSCSDDDPVLSSEKDILKFEIPNIKTEIKGEKILIYVEASQTDLKFLPQITVSPKAQFTPMLENPIDFSSGQTFYVTAEDHTQKTYTTEIVKKGGLESIILYFIRDSAISYYRYRGIIDHDKQSITFNYDKDEYDLQMYKPVVEINTIGSAILDIKNGDELPYDRKEIKITVNNEEKAYKIIRQNIKNKILNIRIPAGWNYSSLNPHWAYSDDAEGLTTEDHIVFVLETENLTNVVPTDIKISIGATISPSVTEARDFSKDVKYTVKSETGVSQDIIVRVVKKKTLFPSSNQTGLYRGVTSRYVSEEYKAISKVKEAYIIDIETNEKQKCEITQNYAKEEKDSYYMIMNAPFADKKKYKLEVVLENGDIVDARQVYSVNFK